MGFWMDWELWEQMCFVLGCLITTVLMYATCVLIYNTWRIKKLGKAERLKKMQEEEEATIAMKDLNLIPFGSRALDSGLAVHGIWTSGKNTPEESPMPEARAASPACSHLNIGSEKPPNTGEAGSPGPTLKGGEGVSAEAKEQSVPAGEPVNTTKPDAGSKSSPPATLEGVSRRSSPPDHGDDSKNGQTQQIAGSGGPSSSSCVVLPHSRNRSSCHSPIEADEDHLRALHSHRRSHVAETGQLGGYWRHQSAPGLTVE